MNGRLPWLILFLSCFSCNTKAQKNCIFSIHNTSTFHIDSIRVTSYGASGLFEQLPPGKKVEKEILINYEGKYEGALLLTIYAYNTIRKQQTIGYYSNSDDIKSKYSVEVFDNFSVKER